MADTTVEPGASPEGGETRKATLSLNIEYSVMPDGTVIFKGGTVTQAKEAADEKLVGGQ